MLIFTSTAKELPALVRFPAFMTRATLLESFSHFRFSAAHGLKSQVQRITKKVSLAPPVEAIIKDCLFYNHRQQSLRWEETSYVILIFKIA